MAAICLGPNVLKDLSQKLLNPLWSVSQHSPGPLAKESRIYNSISKTWLELYSRNFKKSQTCGTFSLL